MIALPSTCPYCSDPLERSGEAFHCGTCDRTFASSRACPGCGFTAYQLDDEYMTCGGCGVFDRRVLRPEQLAAILPPDADFCLIGPVVQRVSRQTLRVIEGLSRIEGCQVIPFIAPVGLQCEALDLGDVLVRGGFAPWAVVSPDLVAPRIGNLRPVILPADAVRRQPDWHGMQAMARELAESFDDDEQGDEGAES